MTNRLLKNLKAYLGITTSEKDALLVLIINKVISTCKIYRKYPSTYDAEAIENDLSQYEMPILDIAVTCYNRLGIEGEKTHDENNVKIEMVSDSKLYDFITPIARVI